MEKLNNDEIKKKLSNTTVDVDFASEWNELEVLLDKKDHKRRWLFWLFGSLGFISLILIGGFLINSSLFKNNLSHSNQETKDIVDNKYSQIPESTSEFISTVTDKKIKKQKEENDRIIQSQNTSTHQSIKTTSLIEKKIEAPSENKTPLSNKSKAPSVQYYKEFNFGKQNKIEKPEFKNPSFKSTKNNQLSLLSTTEALHTSLLPLPLVNRDLSGLQITPIIDKKSKELFPKLLYMESSFATVNDRVNFDIENEYPSLINDGYDILSSFHFEGGYATHISKKWLVGVGLRYNQNRSVFRGQIVTETQTSELQDSAQVYTNAEGGTIYSSGEVITTTTETKEIQQYSYTHNLGIGLNSRYYIQGPFYIGGNVSWLPLHWQSGNMIASNETIKPINQIISQTNRIDLNLNIGANVVSFKRFMIDASLTYRPNRSLMTLEDASISSNNIGGNIRLSYMLR